MYPCELCRVLRGQEQTYQGSQYIAPRIRAPVLEPHLYTDRRVLHLGCIAEKGQSSRVDIFNATEMYYIALVVCTVFTLKPSLFAERSVLYVLKKELIRKDIHDSSM